MIDFVKKHLYVSENENRNETTSELPKPHIVIIGATGSLHYKKKILGMEVLCRS
jgi:hypothetical protein